MLGLGTITKKVFGTPNDRKVKSVRPLVEKINALEPEFQALSDEELAAFGFDTRGTARKVVKELQSLRNNLAHAQDIVTHDWPQVARLARRIEELAAAGRVD